MKNFDSRISKIEKTLAMNHGDQMDQEAKRAMDEFRETAPTWLKEVFAMFFYLTGELADVESSRAPEKWKGIIEEDPNWSLRGNLSSFFWKEFGPIREAVQKTIKALSPGNLVRWTGRG